MEATAIPRPAFPLGTPCALLRRYRYATAHTLAPRPVILRPSGEDGLRISEYNSAPIPFGPPPRHPPSPEFLIKHQLPLDKLSERVKKLDYQNNLNNYLCAAPNRGMRRGVPMLHRRLRTPCPKWGWGCRAPRGEVCPVKGALNRRPGRLLEDKNEDQEE